MIPCASFWLTPSVAIKGITSLLGVVRQKSGSLILLARLIGPQKGTSRG